MTSKKRYFANCRHAFSIQSKEKTIIMSYNPQVFKKVREEFENKRLEAENSAEKRRAEAESQIPGLAETDKKLERTGPRLMAIALHRSNETVEDVKADVTRLRAEHEELLKSAGFAPDYTDPHYACDLCSDTGYYGNRICACMRAALNEASYEAAGISKLIKNCTFESFDLDYYKADQKDYRNMRQNYLFIKDYAEKFTTDSTGLLLFGGTGLGKTHLSVALAKRVTDRGFDVLYTGAVGLLGDFERERFNNSTGTESGYSVESYYTCELLVIDDLGSEISNSFTTSILYDLVNRRINSSLPTVISTNLTHEELSARYSDRLVSRFFGSYISLMFTGKDIRMLKRLRQDRV